MKAQTARQLRKYHQYIGLFFTPAILFFSLSGALQTIGLHENHGGGPPPPTWIRWMASVHKDQRVLRAAPPKPASSAAGSAENGNHADHDHDHAPGGHRDEGPSPVPMKAFVLLLSIGLIGSSLLGATIALTNRNARRPSIIALLLGVVVPVVLLFL